MEANFNVYNWNCVIDNFSDKRIDIQMGAKFCSYSWDKIN